jgi:Transposase DDE domain
LLQHLFGKVFADKGYISQAMFEELMDSVGVQVVTKLKRNMKQRLMSLGDRLLLRKRAVVETVIDQLKNISQIEHSRHRSPVIAAAKAVRTLLREHLLLHPEDREIRRFACGCGF